MSKTPIVLDSGPQVTDVGFAGEGEPRLSIRTLVGRDSAGNVSFGDEAFDMSSQLNLTHPVADHGEITHFDDMKLFWAHCFEKLGVNPSEHPVLVSETMLNLKATREETLRIMMDHFKVPKFFMVKEAATAIYHSGRYTGTVVDLGGGASFTIPVYEGYPHPHAVLRVDVGEKDVTDYGIKLMKSRGNDFSGGVEGRKQMEEIQREHCYVAIDFDEELHSSSSSVEKTITLPNGSKCTIGNERFRMPEAYFKPVLLGLQSDGIHKCLYDSIMKCDVDIRKELYGHIVLTGRGSLYPGMTERLKKEIVHLAPSSISINVLAPADRDHAVWEGGAILANMLSDDYWITTQDYTQSGAAIIHRKCF